MSLLLLRLGTLIPWSVRAIVEGVAVAPPTSRPCMLEQSPLGVDVI